MAVAIGLNIMADSKIYTVQELKKMSEKQLRRLYSKLSYNARKRIAEVEKAGGRLYGAKEFGKLSDFEKITKGELAKRLAFTSRFLAGNTTVARYNKARAQELEKLHESGFTFINENNLESFREYMKEMRNAGALDGTYDSDSVAESFEEIERKKLDVEQFAQNFMDFGDRYGTFTEFKEDWL